ncbi:glycosyltransferase family A protein [Flavobacterium sp. GT3R68]|uniref:glycosyltransferase family 2 protein n=1 Tax=Flavobacterium sp. GT3R68 TaxID=2594437 RepID=UPI000F86E59D|nr:glycosyltransferase family A protein [Flavobacterium sp. GT3R68]RTY92294.1 glycosyltransferase family 2 protein [Flavobacterium sp. GSN2]TRW92530.1 glycosyltransferase family 2 protein [Flavobacterium sp. GT3R68]
MKTLTVFTPTYNRAYCLNQVYESLLRQTSTNFIWLIIDDGSTDNTRELVQSWINESKIEIQYCYKENGGMHTGHNKAYELIKTEFNVCIDSDDFMPDNAVETIVKETQDLSQEYAGIIGLDADKNGNIIGTKIPSQLTHCKLNELYTKYGVQGDKKLVYRTDVVKKYPAYPEFRGEKFVPLDYKCLLIDQAYDLKPVNEVFCIVEYQPDGSTLNIFRQYRKNPRGFAFSRLSRIQYGNTFKEQFKNAIHLVSSALFVKDFSLLKQTQKPEVVLLALPAGLLLNLYVRFKTRK